MNHINNKILVTGASGFLGSHICAALSARGDSVRALYRRKTPPAELVELSSRGVELMNGDLSDPVDVKAAVAGASAVIHCAALAWDWGDISLFRAANVAATAALLDAAEAAGCKTFVFISSAAVQGFGVHVDSTEEGPYFPLKYPYPITKFEAEALVLSRNRPEFRTVAIRPCNVYGPGDRTSTYTMYSAILDAVFGYIGDGSAYTCPLYVDDLCAGVLAALDSPRAGGQAILLTDGQKVSWKRYAEIMFDAVGSKKKPRSMPAWLAFPIARSMTSIWSAAKAKNPPPFTMYRIEQVARHYHFSNAKARYLLGFEPKTFCEEGLVLTAKAFLEERGRSRTR